MFPSQAAAAASKAVCGSESEALRILEQFERTYRDRVAEVDVDTELTDGQRTEAKLKIMTDWVKDLGEQNVMLVQSVHDLEQAAAGRVKLLANKLQETSNLMSYNMSHSNQSADDLNALSHRVSQLQSDQNDTEERIECLKSDIGSLLKLIKRGRTENNWNLDGLTFYEIQPSDIPEPDDCTCGQENGDTDITKNTYFITQTEENKKLRSHINELQDRVLKLVDQATVKDEIIKQIEMLRNSLNEQYNLTNQNHSSSSNIYSECNIASMNDNEKSRFLESSLEIEKLRDELNKSEADVNECRTKIYDLQKKIKEKCKENEILTARLACVEKEASEACEALSEEVAQKHDVILHLKNQIVDLEDTLQTSEKAVNFKAEVIHKLQEENRKFFNSTKKVRISNEPCVNLEDKTMENRLHEATKQLEECENLLVLKDNEIIKLKTILSQKCNQVENALDENLLSITSIEKQGEILDFLTNLVTSIKQDKKTISNLKTEYENVLTNLMQIECMHEKDTTLANERLQDIATCLNNYRKEVIEKDQYKDNIKELISTLTNKVTYIQKLYQNKCEVCVKENISLELTDVISKVKFGIETLSKLYENKTNQASSLGSTITKNRKICNKNTERDNEQEAIFAAILQQFRMMEEFRICTVEVQAATEDLREEISAVLSNLNSRHCKYIELATLVNEVQDYLSKTRENISEVINRLELQDEERARHSERITNNRIRLKDIKNEFNQTQSQLSKCLSSVQNNIQQTNLLGYTEIHSCNDLLISVVEEVEQIVCNLHTFQSQGCCTLSTMIDLKNQLTLMEHKVKELKKKSDQVLLENEAAQKSFSERSKRLEKYECEVDNCQTKMQDVLENINATRDQMNEFGCIKETEDSFQSTTETIKIKDELRRLRKECEELKIKLAQESNINAHEEIVSKWENRVIDLEDQIKMLQNEIKCKQEANIFLKQTIESLEKELDSARAKGEDYRRCCSTECLELNKKILELESALRIPKTESNLKFLTNNETDSKKSQLLDCFNKDQDCDGKMKHGLQGSYENIPQLFKVLQDTIQAIRNGLQGVSDELKRLVSGGSAHNYHSYDSVRAAIDTLSKHIESIKYCSFEVEKIKAALNSKDKLMENMDEIIKIQKDSITISQSEVENLHKTLQEKIDAQEKALSQCELERQQLIKQVELQVQTIGHLQDAVVEAKRNIDQLNNKATSDNSNKSQIIRSLNVYLTETQSQYNDCFDEACEQGSLLELQREAISTLQKKISFLECDEFLNAFILHFVYYVILYKYQEELQSQTRKMVNMKSQIEKLECTKTSFEQQCNILRCKNERANEELRKIRTSYEDAHKLSFEKQREIDELTIEIADLKKQLKTYKLDFDLIEEEMKKMGMIDPSIKSFKTELETMRSKNEQFRCKMEQYRETIDNLKGANKFLTEKLHKLKVDRDADIKKYEEKTASFQKEIADKNEKIQNLNVRVDYGELMINELLLELQHVEDLNQTLHYNQCRMQDNSCDINSLKESKLKLEKNYQKLKKEHEILIAQYGVDEERKRHDMCLLNHELQQTKRQLAETKKNYGEVLRNCLKRRTAVDHLPEMCGCYHLYERKEDEKNAEIIKLTKDLQDLQEKLSSKSVALSEAESKLIETEAKLCDAEAKFKSSDRSCQRQKDEIMLLEKKVACLKQKQQICSDKNDELIRQNKSLEEHNDKCMAELEDIAQQLEDLQTLLNDMRIECDTKARKLERHAVELARIKVSRSEVCEESKYVLEWVRVWMREQKRTTSQLLERLRDKQAQLLRISSEKKRLKRLCRVLAKKRRFKDKSSMKQTAVVVNDAALPLQRIYKCSTKRRNSTQNGFYSTHSRQKESIAVYSCFTRECREGPNRTIDEITSQGNSKYLSSLQHLSKELPRAPQITAIVRSEKITCEDTADYGYQTSSSK